MKTIGIIGGLGPESTLDYYKGIIKAFSSEGSGLDYPEVIIYSLNLGHFMDLAQADRWDDVAAMLIAAAESLHRAGADFGAIASNTPHIVFARVQEKSPIPLLSIVEQTVQKARDLGLSKPGLMGTALIMDSKMYPRAFKKAGMDLVLPDAQDRELIHHRLFSEIELGIIKDSTRAELLAVAGRMIQAHSIDSVILGCTELPLILTQEEFGIRFLNTSAAHIDAIVEYARNDRS